MQYPHEGNWRVGPEWLLKRVRLMAHVFFDDSGKFTDSFPQGGGVYKSFGATPHFL